MPHRQTQEEWETEMAVKILSFIRNEIYLDLRFLKVALGALAPESDFAVQTFATDGKALRFLPERVTVAFEKNPRFLDRLYLHTVLHCVFSHLWIAPREVSDEAAGGRLEAGALPGGAAAIPGKEAGGAPDSRERGDAGNTVGVRERDGTADYRRLWNLACDIAVEYAIDGMDKPCTRRILSWSRQKMYERLRKQGSGVSAAVIYRLLKDFPAEETGQLAKEFYTDDHRYWPRREDSATRQQAAAANRKMWNKIARQTQLEREMRGDETVDGEEILSAQLAAAQSRRTYREFLQKFAVLREELRCDPDEFDLNYYTYGLKVYGNMPLIELAESRESRKIREFMIVIDTSYSTSGDLVEGFLRETVGILRQSDSFFSDSVIRILQCDNAVRSDTCIRGEEEFQAFLKNFRLAGGGGTDFRPAFSYVEELLRAGKCRNLCGLLYFTDGKGIYPKKRPDYKAAFVFLDDYEEEAVPVWAVRHRFRPEEAGRGLRAD